MISTILVPTDYSDASINAVDYAVTIARLNKAKVILLHVFQIPDNHYNFPSTCTRKELYTNAIYNLGIIREMVYQKYNDVMIECEVRYGIAEEEISNYLKLNTVHLLIMGMKNNGYLAKKLFDGIIPFSPCVKQEPVLLVENGIKLKRLVLAYKNEEMTTEGVNESFKEVVLQYKSRIYLLRIMSEYKYAATRKKEAEKQGEYYSHDAVSENIINFNGNFMAKRHTIPIVPNIHRIYQERVYIRNLKQDN